MAIVTRAAKGSALTYAEVDGNFLTPVTVGSTSIQLGATSTTLAGLTSVTLTQDPTAPLQAATKQYVDAVAEGLHVHAACACATTGTLASITGGTVTYNNGTAGVGATLTLSVALTALDGYTLQNGDRILVKNEATQANNGIYTWATGGTVLTRATDFDTAVEIASGDFTFVTYGTKYATSGWVQTTVMVTVGTTPITWSQFSGAGTYTAGTGLTLTGSQFSLTAPVTAALGGTGQTSYTAGDLLYSSGTTTLSKLGIGAANRVLTSSGTAPQWSNTLSLSGSISVGITGLPTASVDVAGGYNSRIGSYSSTNTSSLFDQTGASLGITRLTIQNAFGAYGAKVSNYGLPLVDLSLENNTGLGGILRFESRSSEWINPADTTGEIQWVLNNGLYEVPLMAVGENGLTVNNRPVGGSMLLSASSIAISATLPVGFNAVAVGPVTIQNCTITIPSGSRWKIL